MKRTSLLASCVLVLAPLAFGQSSSTSASSLASDTAYGQAAGTREITLGGSGASNKDWDNSFGTVDFSYGQYLSPHSQWVLRQTVAYSNPDVGDDGWNGATRLVYDYHLIADGTLRPFVGVNGGRVYGDTVNDSWTAGIEGGAKYFVKPQTFVFALASYDWLFEKGDQIDDQFNKGRFGWTLGVGYQF